MGKRSWNKILKITGLEMRIENRTIHLVIIVPIMALFFYFMLSKEAMSSIYILPNISAIIFIQNFTAMFSSNDNEMVLYRIIPVSTREFVIGKNIGNFLVFFLSSLMVVVIVDVALGKALLYLVKSVLVLLCLYIPMLFAGNVTSILAIKRGIRERFFMGTIIALPIIIVNISFFMIMGELLGLLPAFLIYIIANAVIYVFLFKYTISKLEEIVEGMPEGIWMQ